MPIANLLCANVEAPTSTSTRHFLIHFFFSRFLSTIQLQIHNNDNNKRRKNAKKREASNSHHNINTLLVEERPNDENQLKFMQLVVLAVTRYSKRQRHREKKCKTRFLQMYEGECVRACVRVCAYMCMCVCVCLHSINCCKLKLEV